MYHQAGESIPGLLELHRSGRRTPDRRQGGHRSPDAGAQGWGQRGFPVAVQVLEQLAGVQLRTSDAS